MAQIKGKNTKPELIVRSMLYRMGFRFRIHAKGLPGKPDIVFSKHETVIFVHGCFWHRHPGCKNCTTPSTNRQFWMTKLNGNVERDSRHQAALRRIGWRVLTVWECETEKPNKLMRRLERLMEGL